jgi:hypothetical protein
LRFERAEAEIAGNEPDSPIKIDEERRVETSEWHSEWQSDGVDVAPHEARADHDRALQFELRARATELAAASPADAIERALSDALSAATAEGRWSDVAALASELYARRRARPSTVDLGAERARRGR